MDLKILNVEGNQNCMNSSKVMAIFMMLFIHNNLSGAGQRAYR